MGLNYTYMLYFNHQYLQDALPGWVDLTEKDAVWGMDFLAWEWET